MNKISVSMMCADLVNIKDNVRLFEKEGIDYLHIDVMDGVFVPNFGLGSDYIKALRDLTDIPLDIHLMISNPEYKLSWLDIKKTDIVSIHYESTYQVQRALDYLKEYNCKCMLALAPATPVNVLDEVIHYIDGINLLMVNPGHAGQKIVSSTLKKAEKLQNIIDQRKLRNFVFEVDGNITFHNAKILSDIGANMFVAGTSSVFLNGNEHIKSNISLLRESIECKHYSI